MQKEIILSPMKGKTLPLSEVIDPIFSEEIAGKGIAIIPKTNRMVSPVKGRITMIAKTRYAITIESCEGAVILLHIGIDTCRIKEEYFTTLVSEGEEVEVGDVLIEFDGDKITKQGYDIITPIIITNHQDYQCIQGAVGEDVEEMEELIYLEKIEHMASTL